MNRVHTSVGLGRGRGRQGWEAAACTAAGRSSVPGPVCATQPAAQPNAALAPTGENNPPCFFTITPCSAPGRPFTPPPPTYAPPPHPTPHPDNSRSLSISTPCSTASAASAYPSALASSRSASSSLHLGAAAGRVVG